MFVFKVTPDEGAPVEVVATSRDIVRWERITKGAAFAQIAERMEMAAMYKIAWCAAVRQLLFTGTLAEFEETCDLEFEEQAEPDPTQPAR